MTPRMNRPSKPITPQPPRIPPEVQNYFMRDLQPLREAIFPLWQKVLDCDISMWEAHTRRAVRGCEQEYAKLARRWVNAKEKVVILEKLISPDDPKAEEKLGALLAGGLLRIMESHEEQLAHMMNSLAAAIRDKKAEANYKVAMLWSTAAVIVAVLSFIISLFS